MSHILPGKPGCMPRHLSRLTTRRITTISGTIVRGNHQESDRAAAPAILEPGAASSSRAASSSGVNRRQFGTALAGTLMLLSPAQDSKGAEQLETPRSSIPSSNTAAMEPFSNAQQGYSLMVPSGWEKKGKAGADVLFEDPARRSTSIGVTVNPVRVPRIEDFGSLEAIGQRLLDTERKKDSTLGVRMISQQQRFGEGAPANGGPGATLYDYEYELNSTRGRKRILNTVTIYNSKLFILNGNLKCDKVESLDGGGNTEDSALCVALPGSLETLRAAAQSFNIVPV